MWQLLCFCVVIIAAHHLPVLLNNDSTLFIRQPTKISQSLLKKKSPFTFVM